MFKDHEQIRNYNEQSLSVRATKALLFSACRAVSAPAQRLTILGSMVCLALFCLLFRDSLWHFYYTWTTDDNYSHGFLVPILSIYFAYGITHRKQAKLHTGIILGALLLGFAVGLRLLIIALPIPFLEDLAFIIGLTGVFSLLYGSDVLSRYWFVFFFLVFMVPLPIALYSRIASPLQLLASRLASLIMNVTGIPVLCEGNRLTLPGGIQMFVAEACSGMRQLTGFLALTTAVAYLTKQPAWYRISIVVAALPIALIANIARIVLTGYIMHYMNPEYASGTYHTFEGILMMGLGLIILNLLCWVLKQIAPHSPSRSPSRFPIHAVLPAHEPVGSASCLLHREATSPILR